MRSVMRFDQVVVYPVIFEKDVDGYFVTVPDLDRQTQGRNLAEAIEMARDIILSDLLELEIKGELIPQPNSIKFEVPPNAIVNYVDVNLIEYRKKYGYQLVKKNCTIPAWLNTWAENNNVNFSKTLQDALLMKLKAEQEMIE